MKHCLSLALCIVLSHVRAARAEEGSSSITAYALISTGIGYTNNAGGRSLVQELSGANQNNRWGFALDESLSTDMHGVVRLEGGFFGTSGDTGQNGRVFGRQAYVGLSSGHFGAVTLGRQYDAIWDLAQRYSAAGAVGGLLMSPGDTDNMFASWRYNNAVKYVTPTIAALSGLWNGELMEAFSNAAGALKMNRAFSAGLRYRNGPAQLALAYTRMDQPGSSSNTSGAVTNDYSGPPFFLYRESPNGNGVRTHQVLALGGSYNVTDSLTVSVLADAIRFHYLDDTDFSLDNYYISVLYQVTRAFSIRGGYIHSKGRWEGVEANGYWNGAELILDYTLSRWTDVYVMDTFQRASGPLRSSSDVPMAVADTYLNAPSTTHDQNMVTIGIRISLSKSYQF